MKKILKISLGMLFMASALMFVGCKGDDGDPGPAGQAGEKGDKGDKGDAGDQGEGFETATASGNIAITITGKTPADNAFTESIDFKYSLATEDLNSTAVNEGVRSFEVVRLSHPITFFIANFDYLYVGFDIEHVDGIPAPVNPEVTLYTDVTTNDYKYFNLALEFHPESPEETLSITDYSYTPETGKLKFNFTFIVPVGSEDNDTDAPLTVTGKADLTVYELIQDDTDRRTATDAVSIESRIKAAIEAQTGR